MSHTQKHQITLRGLPKEILRELQLEAKQKKISLNETLLRRVIPYEKKPRRVSPGSDLLSLAGTWTSERAKDFENQMKGHRKIDMELWD